MGQEAKLDAADTIFFQRELEEKKAQAYEKKYPELKGRGFCPTVFEYDPGTDSITYEMLDQVGMAKVISNYANDLPRADVKATEHTAKVKSLGSSFGYSVHDIRRARKAGKPLEQRKANASRKAILVKDENIIALGETDHGLAGMLNNSNVPIISAIDIGGSVTDWASKSDQQILDDLNLGVSTVRGNTNGIESPNAVLLPPTEYTRLAQTRLSHSDKTLLQWFLEQSPWITDVDEWHFLETAGVGPSKRAVFYRRDVDYLEHPVPQDYEYPLPPEQRGLELLQAAHARVGGVIWRYPLSSVYMDDI